MYELYDEGLIRNLQGIHKILIAVSLFIGKSWFAYFCQCNLATPLALHVSSDG